MDLLKTGLLDGNPLEVQGTTYDSFPVAPLLIVPEVITPSLELNFATGKQLDSRITFSRGSSATFINSSGLVETAGSGVARFTHNPSTLASLGLLVEESRTNLLLRSEEFDNGSWSKLNCSASGSNSDPAGTSTADTLTSTATDACRAVQTLTITNTTAYAFSCFFKKGNADAFIRWQTATTTRQFKLNLTTGSITEASGNGNAANCTLTSYPNGWWRAVLTVTSDATSVSCIAGIWNTAETDKFGFPGATNGSTCIVWGAQVEAGAFATSYIPTTSATVTRAADVATMTGTNFSSWYNSTEGTFTTDYYAAPFGADRRILSVGPAPASLDIVQQAGRAISIDQTTVATLVTTGNQISTAGLLTKVSAALKSGNYGVCLNGGTPVGDVDTNSITATSLTLGSTTSGLAFLNAPISRIRYYRRRLPDANLQTLTT